MTPYNPLNDTSKGFNKAAQPVFTEITADDKLEKFDALNALIAQTRAELCEDGGCTDA